ncbi:hypothetical protein ACHAW5_004241 [Stephanodiscus triporus]|uniref:DNA polymerase alpha subunit B n=1 Tax=Stephanodiscus triporus TaxID=2934178 RepID=A0ABD3NMM1_9STRA
MDDTAALKRSISRAFASSGHASPLPPDVLSNLAALSSGSNISPSRLAEAWEAHSLTRGIESLDGSTFGGYRRMMLQQQQQHHKAASTNDSGRGGGGGRGATAVVIGTTGLGKRSVPTTGVTPSPAAKRNDGRENKDGLSAVDGLMTSPDSPPGVGRGTKRGNNNDNNNNNKAAAGGTMPPPSQERHGDADDPAMTDVRELVTTYEGSASSSGEAPEEVDEEDDDGGAAGGRRRAAVVVLSPPTDVGEGGGPTPAAAAAAVPRRRPPSGRHMFAPLEARSAELERRLIDVDSTMRVAFGFMDEDEEVLAQLDGIVKDEDGREGTADGRGGRGRCATWTPVGLPKQNEVLCVGRICNEAHEGRLNRASVLLEGSRRHSMGSRVKLDLAGMLENDDGNDGDGGDRRGGGYSLFPGQIVAVEGINPSGRTMRVTRVIEGVVPPTHAAASADVDYDDERRRALSIWTACGPYTSSDDLDYDPFLDLIERVVSERPDVVILCGPFVDGRQPLVVGEDGTGPTIAAAAAADDDGNDENAGEDGPRRLVTPERLFATKVSSLLAELYEADPDAKTQFVLVPSLDDAFVDAVYPQPPLGDEDGRGGAVRRDALFADLGLGEVEIAGRRGVRTGPDGRASRVHLASNPCTLSIDGVVVGVTSTDVLFHLASDGCDAGLPPGSRLARLAGHLVRQGSYYPLFPPALGVPLDMTKAREWEMSVRPDLLVVPSRLASFARPAEDGNGETLVVNPGELTKGTAGGTYARIVVRPKMIGRGVGGKIKMEKTTTSGEDGQGYAAVAADSGAGTSGRGIMDRVRVEIRRI